MNENSRWMWFLMGRILVHAFLGGILCALFGGLLGLISGGGTGFLLDPRTHEIVRVGAMFGIGYGGIAGAGFGTMALGVVGFFSPPRRTLLPSKRILGSVLRTTALAAVGIMATFLLVAGIAALFQRQKLQDSINQELLFITFGAPFVMGCGIISGAVKGCRLEWQDAEQMPVAADPVTLMEAG